MAYTARCQNGVAKSVAMHLCGSVVGLALLQILPVNFLVSVAPPETMLPHGHVGLLRRHGEFFCSKRDSEAMSQARDL